MNHWLQSAGILKAPITPQKRKPNTTPQKREDAIIDRFKTWAYAFPEGSCFTTNQAAESLDISKKYARELALILEKQGVITSSKIKTTTNGHTRSAKVFLKG